jgi:hypothetical protein
VKVIAAWVVGLLVVVGIGVGVEGGFGGSNYLATTTIDQIAVQAATGAGDRAPTSVTWAKVDNYVTPGGCKILSCSPPTSLGTVYMLEVDGTFFDGFTQLLVTVDPSDPANFATEASHGFGPLTGYGTTETASLAGVIPAGA